MATLQSLERKMRTAGDLLSVVKTMKSMASVNIRHYERAVESVEEYRHTVDLAWTVFFRARGKLPWGEAGGKAICLVIGTDQGMCGQFNEVLLSHVQSKEHLMSEAGEVVYWSAGERIDGALMESGLEPVLRYPLPGSLSGVDTRVLEIVSSIESWHREKGFERVFVCHNTTRKGGGYEPVFTRILPLDRPWAEPYLQRKWPRRNIPLIYMDAQLFFGRLFSQYLYIALYRAFGQSLAGENAARLASMQSAEKNIEEMREMFTAAYRQQRQNAITEELFDVVAGFTAMTGEDPSA
jgi:F-type H+-transporting ATPase subunit gamma